MHASVVLRQAGLVAVNAGGRVPAACLSPNATTHRNLSPYRRGSRPGSAGNGLEVAVASVASGKSPFRLSGVASCAGVKDLFFNLSY